MKFLQGTGLLPTAEELAPLTEDQNLAILESLFLTVIADGKIEPLEVKAFAASAMSYPWNWGPTTPELVTRQLDVIAARIQSVSRDGLKDHLMSLRERIPRALREKTFAGMFALMLVDGRLDDKEKTAAMAFAHVLELEQARASELIGQVIAALVAAAPKR